MALTRDQILSAADAQFREVEVPEWGGSVHIRVLNGIERDKLAVTLSTPAGKDTFRATLCRYALCTPEGQPLFTDGDILKLGLKSGVVLDRLSDEIIALNKMGKESIEEASKNSGAAPSVGSDTD